MNLQLQNSHFTFCFVSHCLSVTNLSHENRPEVSVIFIKQVSGVQVWVHVSVAQQKILLLLPLVQFIQTSV